MKLVLKSLTLASVALAAGLAHAESLLPTDFLGLQPPTTQPGSPEAVDLAKVNAVLKSTLGDAIKGDNLVTDLGLKIDNKSNLDQGNIGVTFSAATNNSVWAPNKTVKLSAGLKSVRQTQVGDKLVFKLEGSFRATTDTLALVRWLGNKEGAKQSPNPTGDLEKAANALLENLAKVQTLADLGTALSNFKDAYIKFGDDEEKQQAAQFSIKQKGNTDLLLGYTFKEPWGSDDASLQNVGLDVKTTGFDLTLNGASLIDTTTFTDSIAQVKQILVAIQDKNQNILEGVTELGQQFVELAKAFVLGQN